MPVATSDLYSVFLAIDEEWVQCQADLEEHIVESVKAFLSATERDQDGHRILPNPDRLHAAESEVRSYTEVIRKIRDDACDYLAFKLGNGWSGRDVARCLESENREPLEIAIEAMRRPWHAYVLRQLREKYPEQLAAIEGKHRDGVPVEDGAETRRLIETATEPEDRDEVHSDRWPEYDKESIVVDLSPTLRRLFIELWGRDGFTSYEKLRDCSVFKESPTNESVARECRRLTAELKKMNDDYFIYNEPRNSRVRLCPRGQ